MIPYIEIINKTTLKKTALVEPQECWFELSYYDTGEFEIYCKASTNNMFYLKKGNYVMIPNKPYIWVIESINFTYNEGVPMISAKGYEAKWLLNKRVIQAPVELPTNLAQAVYNIVYNNLGAGASLARQIANFNVELSSINVTLTDTQAPRANVMEFINKLLKTYDLGSIVVYENEGLTYKILQGQDLSTGIRFSQSLDNLIESNYLTDDSNLSTNALVVSNVNDEDYLGTADTGATGVDRAEILINSNLSTEYTPVGASDPVKLDLTNTSDKALYLSWLNQEGNTQLANHKTINEVSSTLDLTNSIYEFDNQFTLGDIVGVIDEYFNYNASARITKITFKQDAKGYGENADYITYEQNT